jgi:hypothetical protein
MRTTFTFSHRGKTFQPVGIAIAWGNSLCVNTARIEGTVIGISCYYFPLWEIR